MFLIGQSSESRSLFESLHLQNDHCIDRVAIVYGNLESDSRVGLCHLHIAALEKISAEDISVRAWNLGRGTPVSVLELVHAFEQASGQKVAYEIGPRRAGDLTAVWADTTRAREELGWSAERTVEDMCADTWRWQRLNPDGYRTAL